MERSILPKVSALCALLASPLVCTACYDYLSDSAIFLQRSGVDGTSGTGGTTTTVGPGCTPSENAEPIDDTCGVFVSSSLGEDGNAGSQEKPVASIAKGVEIALAKGKPLYLCGETFAEAVELAADLRVYGALDCANGWAYAGATRTQIAPSADVIPLRVSTQVAVELVDVDLRAADATVSGGSSIALFAESGAEVTLERCDLQAGKGAVGASPVPEGTGEPGTKGENGGNGCMGVVGILGGSGGPGSCDPGAVDVAGGDGGNGKQGAQGGFGSPGNSAEGLFKGGTAGQAQADGNPVTQCTAGGDGANGTAGEPGDGAMEAQLGTLDASGFSGVAGGDGKTPGTPGAGGGGGGGAMHCADFSSGPSGGGGGSGGCGGAAGKGGQGGGASIGIVSLGATFTFDTVMITTADGGRGGDGGAGQPGGAGGVGGTPGNGDATGIACAGGKGGDGGPGGRGGGGRGGPSIGIAHAGTAPDVTAVTIQIGNGGDGGNGDGATGNGASGAAAPVQSF